MISSVPSSPASAGRIVSLRQRGRYRRTQPERGRSGQQRPAIDPPGQGVRKQRASGELL